MPRTSECDTMAETFLKGGWHFVGADATNANFRSWNGGAKSRLTREGTGQVDKANNVTLLVATVVLARARRGMTNKIRLANAAIVAVEKQRKHQTINGVYLRQRKRCCCAWRLNILAKNDRVLRSRPSRALEVRD